MFRIIAAVLAGYILIGCLVVATDAVFGTLNPELMNMRPLPAYYLTISCVTSTLYSVVGGYVAAVIGRARSSTAAIWLIIFGEIIGVASTIGFWSRMPHWYSFALLILYPPAIWIGYLLRCRRERRVAAAVA